MKASKKGFVDFCFEILAKKDLKTWFPTSITVRFQAIETPKNFVNKTTENRIGGAACNYAGTPHSTFSAFSEDF